MEEIKKFYSEICENEAIISLDQKDFIGFSNKVKIKSFELNSRTKKWLNKKTSKVQRLIICVIFPKKDLPRFTFEWISYFLTIFVAVEKPIFGIYKKDKQKRTKITLIFE